MVLITAATLPMEVAKIGSRGTWAGGIEGIIVGIEVPLKLGSTRGSKGDREGNVAGSEV